MSLKFLGGREVDPKHPRFVGTKGLCLKIQGGREVDPSVLYHENQKSKILGYMSVKILGGREVEHKSSNNK